MRADLDNLRGAGLRRFGPTIALATLLAVGLSGAVNYPVADLRAARVRHFAAAERLGRSFVEERSLSAFRAAGGEARVAEAERALALLFPGSLSSVALFGALRVLAPTSGLVLDTVSVGEPVDAGLVLLEDWITVREVALHGRGELRALARLVACVRDLGYPCAILELEAERAGSGEGFELRATLGLYQALPPPARPQVRTDSAEGGLP